MHHGRRVASARFRNRNRYPGVVQELAMDRPRLAPFSHGVRRSTRERRYFRETTLKDLPPTGPAYYRNAAYGRSATA